MNKKAIKNFLGNTGYVCSKCGKIVIEDKTYENQEGICEDCLIADLKHQLTEKDKEIERLKKIKVPEKVIAWEQPESCTIKLNGVIFNRDQIDVINALRAVQTQPEIQKDLRHQICERIKKDVGCGSKWNGGWIEIEEKTFLEILNDIEKGEQRWDTD